VQYIVDRTQAPLDGRHESLYRRCNATWHVAQHCSALVCREARWPTRVGLPRRIRCCGSQRIPGDLQPCDESDPEAGRVRETSTHISPSISCFRPARKCSTWSLSQRDYTSSEIEASLYAVAQWCGVIAPAKAPWTKWGILTSPRLVRYSPGLDFMNPLDSIPVSAFVVSLTSSPPRGVLGERFICLKNIARRIPRTEGNT